MTTGCEEMGLRQVEPAGLEVGSREVAYWRKSGQRGEPFDAPPAFLPAARVDRPCPLSDPRALRPARRPPRPRRVLSVRRLCRSPRRGLLGLCVPERYGGLGADYETSCLVAEQLAQGNASTALTFNMHCLTMLMMGPIADNMAMPPAVRERHEQLRAAKFREVVKAFSTDSPTASRWSRVRPIPRSRRRVMRSQRCSFRSSRPARSTTDQSQRPRSMPRRRRSSAPGRRTLPCNAQWSRLPRRRSVSVADGLSLSAIERYARDARAAALMRPWTEEIAMQQAWEAALGLDEQRGGAAGA